MGNIVSSLILHSFQRQDILFNILFKLDDADEVEEDLMAGPEENEQVQDQQFPPVHPFPGQDINFQQPLPILNADLNFVNPDLIIDPSKQETPPSNKINHHQAIFCRISRIKTAGAKRERSSDEIMEKRIGHISVWFENKMIIWGGYNDRSGRNHRYLSADQLWVYDPLCNKW